jgi:hypothetical protein
MTVGYNSSIIYNIAFYIAYHIYIVSLWGSVLLHFAIAFRQIFALQCF